MRKVLLLAGLLLTFTAFGQDKTATEGGCPFGFDKMGEKGGPSASATGEMSAEAQLTTPANGFEMEEEINPSGNTNREWWPNRLDLSVLRQHSELSNPLGEDFNYVDAFNSLDYEALKNDLHELMTQS